MDLNRYELVIFDADDTLRECTVEGQFYPLAQGEWVLKGDVCDVLSKYDWTSKNLVSRQINRVYLGGSLQRK